MSPFELSILLHYRGCASDFRDGDFSAPALREAIDHFTNEELLELGPNSYVLTERGKIFVDFLLRVPLPVRMWRMQGLEYMNADPVPRRS